MNRLELYENSLLQLKKELPLYFQRCSGNFTNY